MNHADALTKAVVVREALAHGALLTPTLLLARLLIWKPAVAIPLLRQLWTVRGLAPRTRSASFLAWLPRALTHSPGNIEAHGIDCIPRLHEPSLLVSRDRFQVPQTGSYRARTIFTCQTDYTLACSSIVLEAVRPPEGMSLASKALTPQSRVMAIDLDLALQVGDCLELHLHWDGKSCSTFAGTWIWPLA